MNPQGKRVDNYAQRIISRPGKKDGLYWPTSANEPRSPLGAQAALATLEGYRFGQTPIPYHGYYYKILTAQGPTRTRRRHRLYRQGSDDRRLRAGGLSGGIRHVPAS